MSTNDSAPCRHSGVPAPELVNRVADVILGLASSPSFLSSQGLSAREYEDALPAAIQQIRGTVSADNAQRRRFLSEIFEAMRERGLVQRVVSPDYGKDTIHRLTIPNVGDVAIIQKGCPDGAHSSTAWDVPKWAVESYLWWVCSSLKHQPGTHIGKGLVRLRAKFLEELDAPDWITGVLFHSELCGTAFRRCPKGGRSIDVAGRMVPPPCIYLMPKKGESVSDKWNWEGTQQARFPKVLLETFGIGPHETDLFVGQIGFYGKEGGAETRIVSRFGLGRSTTTRG